MGWQKDCKIEVIYRGTGTTSSPGGQQVGTPASDIRVTHIPTGIMAQYGESRSQHKCLGTCYEMIEWALLECKFITPSKPTGEVK